jgi:hypothetical protein
MAHMSESSAPDILLITPSRIAWLLRPGRSAAAFAIAALMSTPVLAQPGGSSQGGSSQDDPTLRFLVPTVTVTAQKEPEDKQKVPISVTAH